jgi:iron complex transport system permease protein
VLFLLHRQLILLSAEEGEARMLGVNVGSMRLLVLLLATLVVASVVSLSGLISFVGLLAPHGARLLTKNNRLGTMLLSGLVGGILLCGADILARSVAQTELPVSIFTSLLGAPFLIYLIVRGRRNV